MIEVYWQIDSIAIHINLLQEKENRVLICLSKLFAAEGCVT